MSLSRKVTMIVIMVFLVSGLLNLGIQEIFIMPSFITLEKKTAIENADRVKAAIKREISQIKTIATDWSHWTDTYNYMKGVQPEYEAENLDFANPLDAINMNFLGYYDTTGKNVWSKAKNLESGEILDLGQLSETKLSAEHPLLQHKELMGENKGLILTLQGPMLIVAAPVLTSYEEGPIAGTLMMGRLLNDAAIRQISEITRISAALKTISQEKSPAEQASPSDSNSDLPSSSYKIVKTPGCWQVQTALTDIYNTPILSLQIDTPRDISAQGAKAVNQSLWVFAATGILVMLLLWQLLQQAVLRPLATLTTHALRIGQDDTYTKQLNLERKDETGILAQTFDQMIERLAETKQRLIVQSYNSGVAEMASGVLHNIGNAITPLNIRLTTLLEQMKTAPLAEMDMAEAELADPATPSERREDLQQFITLARTEMATLIKKSQEGLALSIQQVDQVREILNDQQRFSRSARVIEPVDMAAVIREANAGLVPKMSALIDITIKDSVAEYGLVSGARTALRQVVDNILINAVESIQSNETKTGRVIVSAEKKVVQGKPMVEFCFQDNGGGIDSEHQEHLFERDFSTKNRAGSGYGLHWSANTLQALGGQLTAKNNGKAGGASLLLLLPAVENSDELKDYHGE
jgi:sensor domain CHASE-containing protein